MEKVISVPSALRINLLREPYGIEPEGPAFSWVFNGEEKQTAYRLLVASAAGKLDGNIGDIADTGKTASDESSYVKIAGLSLKPNHLYFWKVKTWDTNGAESGYSEKQAFTTAVGAEWASTGGIWSGDTDGGARLGDFVFLRTEFAVADPDAIEKAVVSVTAQSPDANRMYVYSLYLNGRPVGLGPAPAAKSTFEKTTVVPFKYDTYDVTSFLHSGVNGIGAANYTTAGKQFLLQMTVFYKDGTSKILLNSGRDRAKWQSLDGTKIYGEGGNLGTPYYAESQENIRGDLFPSGWSEPGFDASSWAPAAISGQLDGTSSATISGTVTTAVRRLVPSTTENMNRYPVPAAKIVDKGNGDYFIDLGKEIVGGICLNIVSNRIQAVTVEYGEQLSAADTVKYALLAGNIYKETWTLKKGRQRLQSLGYKAFRYIEILNSPVPITSDTIHGVAVRQAFDENASSFWSSSDDLNRVYAVARYTIKASNQTIFYSDFTRERGVYEGDALINMLSAYAVDPNPATARYTMEYLIDAPTWPAEYKLQSVLMAWADTMYTGNLDFIRKYYGRLKSGKLFDSLFDPAYSLIKNSGKTGETDPEGSLLCRDSTGSNTVLVDWPANYRDGYRETVAYYSTAFNAFCYAAYEDMAKIADILEKKEDAAYFSGRAEAVRAGMMKYLYNPEKGAFRDGLTSQGVPIEHYAEPASVYPLALGVVDGPAREAVSSFVAGEGMKMSIYGAFFVLLGLYNADRGGTAMERMTSKSLHGWLHTMDGLGATMATEAWDPSEKPNMTFSHPWGSAPASQIPGGVFGIRPTKPGFREFQIKFQPGNLTAARVRVPTVKGTISASFDTKKPGFAFYAALGIPANTTAIVYIPAPAPEKRLFVDGAAIAAEREGPYLKVSLGAGERTVALRVEPV